MATALLTGLFAVGFRWSFPVVVLAVAAVVAGRLVAEFAVPRGTRLELADDVVAQESQVGAALASVEAKLRLGAPPQVVDRAGKVAAVIREIAARQPALAGSSRQLFSVLRTATDYLPTAIEAFMRLPQGYATSRRLADGRTALKVLIDQLDLLEKEMVDVADAVTKNDLDRLLAHGRFLEERFRPSALTLPEPVETP